MTEETEIILKEMESMRDRIKNLEETQTKMISSMRDLFTIVRMLNTMPDSIAEQISKSPFSFF